MGEFGFVERLTKEITTVNKETVKGIGDDAAILQFGSDEEVLITTDLFMEGVHFDLTYFPLKHLGYKVVVANISDIYAMNGTPKQITVSLGISRKFCIEDIEELYSGIRLACEQYGVDIVGGDTTSSLTGLAISITATGTAPKGTAVKRSTAKETDLICVTGNLGECHFIDLFSNHAGSDNAHGARSQQSGDHQVGNDTCQTGSAIVVLSQANANANGEQDCHVVDQGAACLNQEEADDLKNAFGSTTLHGGGTQ